MSFSPNSMTNNNNNHLDLFVMIIIQAIRDSLTTSTMMVLTVHSEQESGTPGENTTECTPKDQHINKC